VAFVLFGIALGAILVRLLVGDARSRTTVPSVRAGTALVALAAVAATGTRHVFVASSQVAPDDAFAVVTVAVAVIARGRWPGVVAGLAVATYLLAGATLIAATPYHSDAVVAAHAGAERVLAGSHPYDGFDLVAELGRFGLPPTYATPLDDGTRLRSLQYPALTFLVPAPFVAAGLGDLRVLYLAEVLLLFALTYLAAPAAWRPVALACCLGNAVILAQFVDAGVDPLWAVFVLVTWMSRKSRLSAVPLGLAIATRQQAWLVAPFVLAWVARRSGAREALVRGAVALAIALLIHAPFLATAPLAVLRGVTDPALLPLEPWGIGPAKLAADGTGPLFPRVAYLLAAAAGYVLLLLAFATRRARGALALPLLPLWLAWRALQSYFALVPVFLLTDERDD
jgi:hypothetical protein